MKIYPSTHAVKEVQRPEFLDIPLSHIEKHLVPEKIVTEIDPRMSQPSTEYLAPYQEFDSDDFLIFEDDGSISKTELVFKDGTYSYRPQAVQEFVPTTFECSALLQRNGKLRGDKNYDFKIGVYNESRANEFANKLMQICGDAPYRGMAPSNITVNGGSTDIQEMLSDDPSKFDFFFVQGSTDEFRKDLQGSIPYDKFYQSHANLWITLTDEGCQKYFNKLDSGDAYKVTSLIEKDDGTFAMMPPESPENIKYTFAGSTTYPWYSYYSSKLKMFQMPSYKYLLQSTELVESPIFIIERKNGCFIVVSHECLFDHLNLYGYFIYNVLQKLYERSYVSLKSKTYWIADSEVDYLGSLDVPFHKKHLDINLNDMIVDSKVKIDDYVVKRIYTNAPEVTLDRQMDDGQLYFKKVSTTDPVKIPGDTSIFTYQQTILQYAAQKEKFVESGIQINTGIENGRCYLTVLPFASSKYKLLTKQPMTFEIPEIDKTYILYALPVNANGTSRVGIIREDDKDYNEKSSVKLARIHVEFEGESEAYDIRQLGGGLPTKFTDYDMIDIGNSKGRPYRMGVGAVIRLPKVYQKYADKIQQAIEKYKVAADKFYVIYE